MAPHHVHHVPLASIQALVRAHAHSVLLATTIVRILNPSVRHVPKANISLSLVRLPAVAAVRVDMLLELATAAAPAARLVKRSHRPGKGHVRRVPRADTHLPPVALVAPLVISIPIRALWARPHAQPVTRAASLLLALRRVHNVPVARTLVQEYVQRVRQAPTRQPLLPAALIVRRENTQVRSQTRAQTASRARIPPLLARLFVQTVPLANTPALAQTDARTA